MLRRCCAVVPITLLRRGRIQYPMILQQRTFSLKGKRNRVSGFHKHPPNGDHSAPPPRKKTHRIGTEATFTELRHLLLHVLEKQPYGRYNELESISWRHFTHQFTLSLGSVQVDPYAPPTRCRLTIPASMAQFPASLGLRSSPIRRMAAADYLWRQAALYCQRQGNEVAKVLQKEEARAQRRAVKGWSGAKGGDVQIMTPTQHVMEQSAVQIDAQGNIVCHVTVNLPAEGRKILGSQAYLVFNTVLAYLVHKCFIASSLPMDEMKNHIDDIADQAWLQEQLDEAGLVAFVRDGAILPRRSGMDDRPLKGDTVVPFQSAPSLQVSFTLPNTGRTITGLGIRKGVTLIYGGGYHGKSTLLETIQNGVYLKVPADGREFCVTSKNAMKIRAEDGRWVASVDISSFIKHAPFGRDTTCFSTADASGSTSQASNIVEAVELGANALLIDEDTCATNFMIRDSNMTQLVSCDKEPITPFVRVVTSLKEQGISTILVVGGTGDFFAVADHVLIMDHYRCEDATARAHNIVRQSKVKFQASPSLFGPIRPRCLHSPQLMPNGKVKLLARNIISYGDTEIDLSLTEQIVSSFQANAIASALQYLSEKDAPSVSMNSRLDALEQRLDSSHLDEVLAPGQFNGTFMRPRKLEVGAALNRLRRNRCIEPMKSVSFESEGILKI